MEQDTPSQVKLRIYIQTINQWNGWAKVHHTIKHSLFYMFHCDLHSQISRLKNDPILTYRYLTTPNPYRRNGFSFTFHSSRYARCSQHSQTGQPSNPFIPSTLSMYLCNKPSIDADQANEFIPLRSIITSPPALALKRVKPNHNRSSMKQRTVTPSKLT